MAVSLRARVAGLLATAILLATATAYVAARLDADPALVAVAVAAAGVALGALALVGLRVAERSRDARAARLDELRELLDVADSEAESRTLLLRHVQRLAPEAGAVVLSRVESEERLEPVFGERVAETPLQGLALHRLTPDACLAMRLGRTHAHDDATIGDELSACRLCGRFPGAVICEPLRAANRTLGSLLVAGPRSLRPAARDDLHAAVAAAAPVIVIQRSLAVTERQAASDPLTGLPNRRAADETLRRLSAQAGRTVSPVAALVIDLDRFRIVNDRFGHEHGDAALVGVGEAIAAGVRASDFVARYGGEEFLVLAPDTDRHGATGLAEKLRRDIEALIVPGVGRITASVGVAALPEDALQGEDLVRRAIRALAIAKALGRNRVQGVEATPATEGET